MIDRLVVNVINRIITQSVNHSFRSEDEIRGYIVATIQNLISKDDVCIQEYLTTTKYSRNQKGFLEVDSNGRSGQIDIVINYNDVSVGIEIEYPRGRGFKVENYISHVSNDIMKLNGELALNNRFLIIISYNDPPRSLFDLSQSGMVEFGCVNVIHLRLAKLKEGGRKKSVIKCETIPKDWVIL